MPVSRSYPLDTLKVRLQSSPGHYNGMMHCARSVIQTEGVRRPESASAEIRVNPLQQGCRWLQWCCSGAAPCDTCHPPNLSAVVAVACSQASHFLVTASCLSPASGACPVPGHVVATRRRRRRVRFYVCGASEPLVVMSYYRLTSSQGRPCAMQVICVAACAVCVSMAYVCSLALALLSTAAALLTLQVYSRTLSFAAQVRQSCMLSTGRCLCSGKRNCKYCKLACLG